MTEPPDGFSDIRYVSGVKGRNFRRPVSVAEEARSTSPRYVAGGLPPGRGLNVDGLPIVKPPYGLLSAIDMNKRDLLFQVAHGETPDAVRNHPKLQGLDIPMTGQGGATTNVGLLITKSLVILGDPQETNPPDRPRGAMLRAYDKLTGGGGWRDLYPGQSERWTDDLHGRRPTVHHRGRQRPRPLGRVPRVRLALRKCLSLPKGAAR